MKKSISAMLVVLILATGCSYTESALEYSREGTARIESGYDAKAKMTEALTAYLISANKDCGTQMEIINNVPVVKVKECVRVSDVMASVDKVDIIKPQQVSSIMDSAGDFVMKATNLVVPVAGIYYNYRTHEKSMDASVANTASNNQLQGTIFENYQNTTTNTSTSVTDTSSTATINDSVSTSDNVQTTTVPNYSNDGTTTTIGD